MVIAGIAVSDTGRIWISDAANHRVILLNNHGEFELVIGTGTSSADENGFDTPSGELQLTAWAYVPPGRSLLALGNATGWPRLVNRLDPPAIWQELRRPGVLLELRLEPGPAALIPNWPSVSMAPQKHQGYAVQWFGLAAALLALFIHLGIHRAREARHASIAAP